MSDENDHSASEIGLQVVKRKIFGEPASKANSRRLVHYGGMSRLIKSAKALTYTEVFRAQCEPITPLLEGDVTVVMTIYYASRRPDLDESLILDLLQGLIYVNDRQVKIKHVYWALSKEQPRVELEVWELPKKEARKTRALKIDVASIGGESK